MDSLDVISLVCSHVQSQDDYPALRLVNQLFKTGMDLHLQSLEAREFNEGLAKRYAEMRSYRNSSSSKEAVPEEAANTSQGSKA